MSSKFTPMWYRNGSTGIFANSVLNLHLIVLINTSIADTYDNLTPSNSH